MASGPLILDVTYWYRWGNDVTLYTVGDGKAIDEVNGDIGEQMIMLSAIVHMQ